MENKTVAKKGGAPARRAEPLVADAVWASLRGREHRCVRPDHECGAGPGSRLSDLIRSARSPHVARAKVVG